MNSKTAMIGLTVAAVLVSLIWLFAMTYAAPDGFPHFFTPTMNTSQARLYVTAILLDDLTNQPSSGVVLCLLQDDGDRIVDPDKDLPGNCVRSKPMRFMSLPQTPIPENDSHDLFLEEIVTDTEGNFDLLNLAPGGYWLLNGDTVLPIITDQMPAPFYFEVPVDGTLIVRMESTYNVEGILVDYCSQRPVPGVILCLFADDGNGIFDPSANTPPHCVLMLPETQLTGNDPALADIITNDQGEFRLSELVTGDYYLAISDPSVSPEFLQSFEPYLFEIPMEGEIIIEVDAITDCQFFLPTFTPPKGE